MWFHFAKHSFLRYVIHSSETRNYYEIAGASVASFDTPPEYKSAVDLWSPWSTNDGGAKCPPRMMLQAINDALDQARIGCVLTVFSSGPASDYSEELMHSVMLKLMDRKCKVRIQTISDMGANTKSFHLQLNVIMYDDGNNCLGDGSTPASKAVTDLATVSNGDILRLNPATQPAGTKPVLEDMFKLIKSQANCIRYTSQL